MGVLTPHQSHIHPTPSRPLFCPQALIDKGQAWLRQCEAVLALERAPLKRLRDLLHAGLRLPVEMPQVERLRGDIRRWVAC